MNSPPQHDARCGSAAVEEPMAARTASVGRRILFVQWYLSLVLVLFVAFLAVVEWRTSRPLGQQLLVGPKPKQQQPQRTLEEEQQQDEDEDNDGTTTTKHGGSKKAKFLFTIGLEGTGHHFVHELFLDSPHIKRLQELGIHPQKTNEIAKTLYKDTSKSIFTAWQVNLQHHKKKPIVVPLADMQKKLARLLIEVQDAIIPDGEETNKITIPVNTIHKAGSGVGIGMMSYPSFGGELRYLQHPNLDLFYQACDLAAVECSHIYIYRDPYSIIHSTTQHRHFQDDVLEAAQLYVTELGLITGQLLDHAHRTEGCFGFYDADFIQDKDNDMLKILQNLLGWKKKQKFWSYLNATYHPPKPLTNEEKSMLVPTQYEPAVQSWMTAHHRTINLCRTNVAKYQNNIDDETAS